MAPKPSIETATTRGIGPSKGRPVLPRSGGQPSTSAGGAGSGAGGLHLKPRPYTVTIPPPDDYYLVREGQLDDLTRGGKDHNLEYGLFAAGAAIGIFTNAWATIRDIFQAKQVSAWDYLLLLIAVGLLIFGLTKLRHFWKMQEDKDALKNKIKSGQKATVEE